MFRRALFAFSVLFGVLTIGVFLGIYLVDVGYVSRSSDNVLRSFDEITIDLTIDYGNNDIQTFPQEILFSGQTVLDLLTAMERRHGIVIETRNFPGMGKFVEAIHGVHSTNNMYWQYWVNNEYGIMGAGQYILKDGDNIHWKRTNEEIKL
jgi:hypothetical protein